jgi:hypothetical protein
VVQFAPDALLEHARLQLNAWGRPLLARRTTERAAGVAPARADTTRLSYGARKPYVVAACLDELCGPTAGTITLPAHLDWSGNATYDLGRPARLASMYRTVLNEAGSAADLRAWLDARLLAQLWPSLWLPSALRRVWEDHFPELSALRLRAV